MPFSCRDPVRVRRRRAVGAFDDRLGLDVARRSRSVIWFSSAAGIRMSTSSVKICSLVSGSPPGKPSTVLCSRVQSISFGMSRPCLVVDAALPVGHGDDLRRELRDQVGRHRADVAEALHGHRRAAHVDLEVLGRLARADHHAAAGRLAPAVRAAEHDRLARDDGGLRAADVHGVGVHEPRHDLLVRVDVRRGHVLVGADRVDDLGDVAARQRLELAPRHARRVADDAALAAAERDLRDRALPRHPRGQRRDLVERDVGVVADAALRGPER